MIFPAPAIVQLLWGFFSTKHPFSFSDWALMLYSLSLTGLTEEQREWRKEWEWMNKGVWRWAWLSSSRLKVATVSTINNTHSLQRPANGLRDESGRWLLDEQMITLGLTQGHHPLSLLLSRPLYALFHYPFPFFSVLFVLILLTFFPAISGAIFLWFTLFSRLLYLPLFWSVFIDCFPLFFSPMIFL